MANEHFTFSEKIRSGSWSTAAWHALMRFLNDRFTAVETGFDGMPTEAEIATLTDIAAVTPADGTFLVGDNTDFVGESGSTVRTSAGLGASDNVTFATVTGTTSGTFGGVKIWDGPGSGTNNIVVGLDAGFALTTGNYNVFVGENAGGTSTTGDNNLVLGNAALSSSETVSNEITLGDGSITAFRIPGLSATSVDATKWGYVTGADQAVKKADTPQFAGIELGHASDTTLARSSAGNVTIEGNLIYRAGGTDVPVTDGGTGRSTSTTAYGLIAAGTTATGAHQTLSAGATTAVLVGGGSSALPVWTTATGSGAPVRATSPTLVTPTLGAASATSLTTTGSIELGHASDTTVARSSAGNISVEGNQVLHAGNSEVGADITDTTNVTAAGALMDSEMSDLAGAKAMQGFRKQLYNVLLADDTATSFDLEGTVGSTRHGVILMTSNVANYCGIFIANADSAPAILDLNTSGLTLTSGSALTGTTGTDGNFTVSAHTDGKLYFENRTGISRRITVHSLG